MKRKDVLVLVNGERDYQNSLKHHSAELDANASVSEWIIFIEKHIENAKGSIYHLDKASALEEVLKVAALAVACMENNDTKPRQIG